MEIFSRIVLQVLIPLQWLVNIIAHIFGEIEIKKLIPRSSDKLLHTSATKLAEKIRNKEISSEKLVSTYINRIKEVNPIVNAIIEDRFAEALEEAKQVDRYLENSESFNNSLAETKPLLGIPITIKECLAVKGLSYTGCCLSREGVKAKENARAVELVKEAGGIILLVSSTPEYCSCLETGNKIIGLTKNPYDTRYASGGSSGGEGALLGAGASIIGIASDIAGSIRIPCSFNGVYGHKPTSGIVSIKGAFPMSDNKRFSEYLAIGPMCRYVEDLKLALKVLTKPCANDLNLDQNVDFKNLTVYYMEDSSSEFGLLKVDPKIKVAVQKAVKYLNKKYECQISETKFPEMSLTTELCSLVCNMKNAPDIFRDAEEKYNPHIEFLKFLFGKSVFSFRPFIFSSLVAISTIADDQAKYLEYASKFKTKFVNTLGNNGIFLYPSFPQEACPHYGYIKYLSGMRFHSIFNIFGCPATNVPVGLSKNRLPLAIQVVAAPYQDNLCLEVAKELNDYFGGWVPPY